MNTFQHNKFKTWWANVNTTFALQVFNILRFVSTFFAGVVLVKVGWTEVSIESYEYLLITFGMLTFFWISGTQNGLLSLLPKTDKKAQAVFLKKSLSVVFAFGVFVSVLILFVGPFVSTSLQSDWLFWLCVYSLLNIPSLFLHIKYLLESNAQKILLFGMLNFFAQFIFIAIPAWMGEGLCGVLIAMTILAGLRFLFFVYDAGLDFKFDLRYREWLKKWGLLSLPLSLHILIGVSPEYVDAFLVEYFIEEEGSYAIYKYGARELPLVISLITALATAVLPVISEDESKGLSLLKAKTKRLSHLLFPAAIILMFFSPFLFEFFYNSSFRDSAIVFNVYLLILLTRMFLPQVLITARQNNYILLWCGIAEFAVNVGVSIMLVSSYGLFGIAIGTVAGNFIQKVLMSIYVKRNYGLPISAYVPLKTIAIYSLGLLVSFWLSMSFTGF